MRNPPESQGEVVFDFNSVPVLASHPQGFIFGNARDECLGVHTLDGLLLESVCHEWIDRPALPVAAARKYAEAAEDARQLAQSRGLAVVVLDLEGVWPFRRIFVTTSSSLAYVSPVIGADGAEFARLVTPTDIAMEDCANMSDASDFFVSERKILAVREEPDGTRIANCRWYPVSHSGDSGKDMSR